MDVRRVGVTALAALAISVVAGHSAYAQNKARPAGAPAAKKEQSAADLDPQVKKLQAQVDKLEKQLKARPKDAKLKNAVAEAHYKAGYACEYSKGPLPPVVRYRTALKHYRRALALNPGHAEAKKEKEQIEMIYRSMGRPVPN